MKKDKVLLLCKGSSMGNFDFFDIDINDYKVAWANLHNIYKYTYIPRKIDYLYIRNINQTFSLDKNNSDILNNLNIPNIISVFKKGDSFLKYKVTKHLNISKDFDFTPCTGLISWYDLCNLNFSEIITVGMDLFNMNSNMYYHDIKDNISSEENQKSLINSYVDIDTNKLKREISWHPSKETLNFINKTVKKFKNIKFVFYTSNNLFDALLENKNVKIFYI